MVVVNFSSLINFTKILTFMTIINYYLHKTTLRLNLITSLTGYTAFTFKSAITVIWL